jgi:hypothetical protein
VVHLHSGPSVLYPDCLLPSPPCGATGTGLFRREPSNSTNGTFTHERNHLHGLLRRISLFWVVFLNLNLNLPQGQPRHRVVISLGDAPLAQEDWKAVAAMVADQLYGQTPLVPATLSDRARQYVDSITRRVLREGRWLPLRPAVVDPQAQSLDGVLVDQVTHSQSAVLGPALLAYHAWKELGLPAALRDLGFNPTQQALAAAAVINRLVEPLSEHALAAWLAGTALPDLLGEGILKGDSNRFYYVSDALLRQQGPLEAHLRGQQARHFHHPRTILLYDLTNTHFEGRLWATPRPSAARTSKAAVIVPKWSWGWCTINKGLNWPTGPLRATSLTAPAWSRWSRVCAKRRATRSRWSCCPVPKCWSLWMRGWRRRPT